MSPQYAQVVPPRFSVVVPVHNEDACLDELYRRLATVLNGMDDNWELVLVDDGSRDRSFETMVRLRERDPRVKIVRLSRNFGHQLAITAGLDMATGDAVVIMDGDLQHPPEVIPELVARWEEGNEVVYGVITHREGVSPIKRLTASLHYRLIRRLTDVEMPVSAGDFRLLDRSAAQALSTLRERNRYLRGMVSWVGFRQIGVPYVAAERFAGRPTYTYGTLLRLAKNGIFSFSNVPLRLVLTVGFVVSGLAVVEGLFALVNRLGGFNIVPGWASIVIVVSFLGGIQLIVLGVMGEYVGLIYDEVKGRPIYLVRELHGFEAEE